MNDRFVLADKCMRVLCEHVGVIEAEQFIYFIKTECFDYTEWQHTTPDDQRLTISDSAHGAFLILDRPDSFVVVSVAKSGWADSFNDGRLDEDLEAVADSFSWAALDDPALGMDGEFTYHQYSSESAVERLTNPDIDLSMIPESQANLKPTISAVYEQQIAPYIQDFHLVDYSIEWGKADIGWISFTGTPVKPINWRTVPSDKGTVYCRSVCVTRDENGLPLALESFDMLPIPKKDMSKNIGTEENPDWVWMKNEAKDLASASLYVQQDGKTYTVYRIHRRQPRPCLYRSQRRQRISAVRPVAGLPVRQNDLRPLWRPA